MVQIMSNVISEEIIYLAKCQQKTEIDRKRNKKKKTWFDFKQVELDGKGIIFSDEFRRICEEKRFNKKYSVKTVKHSAEIRVRRI